MAWSPLITDELRAPIARILTEIVAAVEAAPEQAARTPGDCALLRAYLANDDLVPDPDDAGGSALAIAVNALTSSGPGLFGGIAGIGWTVAHLADGDVADRVCDAIDRALVRRLEPDRSVDDYDLIGGLVGFGVYALERGPTGLPIATRVLDQLEHTAVPRAGGLAWHTRPELLPPWQRAIATEGYWNLGLAHGIPGVIGLLARYLVHGVDPARSRRLLDGAVTFMLAAAAPSPTGRYASWLVGPTGSDTAASFDAAPTGRLAWCYGDLGISVALLAAAQATGDARWRAEAITLGADCARRPVEHSRVVDTGLCHGALGAAHVFNRLRAATGEAVFADASRTWLERGLGMRSDRALAGFPSLEVTDNQNTWHADASLLTGASGVALALQAMISEQEPTWDRLLLVDVACD